MNVNRVIQWLGMICLIAGVARMGMTPTSMIWGTDSVQELIFGFSACILMSVGSIALHIVQSREAGVLSFIGTLGIIVGNVMTTALVFTAFFPGIQEMAEGSAVAAITGMISMIGLTGGTVLYAIVTFRANVFPRWVAVLHVVMLLSAFLPVEDNKYFAFFWGLSYVGAGLCIWIGKLTPRSAEGGKFAA